MRTNICITFDSAFQTACLLQASVFDKCVHLGIILFYNVCSAEKWAEQVQREKICSKNSDTQRNTKIMPLKCCMLIGVGESVSLAFMQVSGYTDTVT